MIQRRRDSMQLITEEIRKSMEGSSWIRKMFEKGLTSYRQGLIMIVR